MLNTERPRHGGQILVDQLALQGCDTVFCVPGESYLAALDGLHAHNGIRTVVCRQEGGASMMADAYAKMTGKVGVAFVTRGPGATNASSGVHVAFQDSTPMILFVGQVERGAQEREAFQEIDYRRMFEQMAKWVGQIDDIHRIPEYISHAFHHATSGRPGPVVLALPEDMLTEEAIVEDARPAVPTAAEAGPQSIDALASLLTQARRPLIMVGGGGWNASAARDLGAFAERYSIPVCASFRCQDYIDNRNPAYVGHTGIAISATLADAVKTTDLLICIGARLGELTTRGYELVSIPNPSQKLVHTHPGAEELGRVYRPDLAINAASPSVAETLAALELTPGPDWRAWCSGLRDAFERDLLPEETPGAVKLEQVITWLSDNLGDDAVIANGAGNYSGWVHRYYRFRNYRTQLAPTSGSMGYGVPAAVSAKLARPDAEVVCIAGDGCFMMTAQELATALQHGLAIVYIVVNNGMFGTIRMHQERNYPGRLSATTLVNPDFAAMARSFGAHGELVADGAEFPAAFERARNAGVAALIELRVDPDALSPRLRLSELTATGTT
ncbi:MAG: thiamine pyrophosphate-binding protein [Pseudomonadota bacterium]